MFGFGGRTSRGKLVKAELGESVDHLMRAATHAAYGVGATVGPRADAARVYLSPTATMVRRRASDGWESTMTRFAPLAVAAADGARQAGSVALKARSKKMKAMRKKNSMARRRWPMLTGLLVAGAVAGAVGAIAMRRRQQPWDEYDPAATLDAVRDDAATIVGSSAGGAVREPLAPKSSPVDKVKDRTAAAGEKLSSTTAPIGESVKKVATKSGDKSQGLLGTAAAPSRNSGS